MFYIILLYLFISDKHIFVSGRGNRPTCMSSGELGFLSVDSVTWLCNYCDSRPGRNHVTSPRAGSP